ncbi:MAG TPA: SLC13 family permease [Spirochaetales bacterium]|nr:hypothetical protein [Spirochaetales bacterium]HOV38569.1 SLC13 family permease [Spirochaetales bacterium]
MELWMVAIIFIVVFALVLYRKFPIQYVSLAGAAVLILLGIIPVGTALTESIEWEVIFIYFGYGMLSVLLEESRLPRALADAVIPKVHSERDMIFVLSALAALLSSFMPNPVVVLMVAPVALDVANRLKRSPFPYLVSIAIASNVVTTVSMVADPPSLILAMATNMTFLDFYWFQGRPGLGTLSILGVLVALSTLLYLHRNLNAPLQIQVDQYRVPKGSKILFVGSIFLGIACLVLKTWFSPLVLIGILGIFAALVFFLEPRLAKEDNTGEATGSANEKREILFLAPSAVFVLSVFALILAPTTPPSGFLGLVSWQGWIGFVLGLLCILTMGQRASQALKEYDWETTLFLLGIFIVIDSVDRVGILSGLVDIVLKTGLTNPFLVFTLITWLSVALSAFIDNVPYTVLMIPVCGYFAKTLGINPYYLYYGMLIGTGIGGNITPVGATANVLACGMLEKRGIKIDTLAFMRISVPFSVSAVLVGQLLVQFFWAK